MSCSSCGAAFAGACGRGSSCDYNYYFGEPVKKPSSFLPPSEVSSSNDPVEVLNEWLLNSEPPSIKLPKFTDEELRTMDKATYAAFKYSFIAVMSPFWVPFMISKSILDEKYPENKEKSNHIKAAAITVALLGIIGIGGKYFEYKNDKEHRSAPASAPAVTTP